MTNEAILDSRDGSSSPSRRILRINLQLLIGFLFVFFWLVVIVFVDFFPLYNPYDMVGARTSPPSFSYWFGTDALGRDVFSRTLYGARSSLILASVVIVCSVIIGSTLGAVAGYIGRLADVGVMRMVDITASFPPILLAMAISASLGAGIGNAAIAIIVVWWPIYARLMRAQVLTTKHSEHVEAAIAGGAGHIRTLRVHILPLCWTPILVNSTMEFGQVVLLAASLSFIGLGTPPPTPEWGSMISEGALHFYSWWICAAPALAIVTVAVGFNFLGDGLRDLLDPRSKQA